jgi:hypothetical protein
MNLFLFFGDGAITRKKLTETLHYSLHAMMQFPSFWGWGGGVVGGGGGGDTPLQKKAFLNSYYYV